MTAKPKAALLPLYLKLYDEALPKLRETLAGWLDTVAAKLAEQGLEIVRCPICRVEKEFIAAVGQAEAADADVIITLHLAYSPSLESADALAATKLPLVMLDTTMDFDFGQDVDPARLAYNHGIHGVQDLANMLLRREKPFKIVAGHFEQSDVLARAADLARAAKALRRLRRTKALRIGSPFIGMGDFSVSRDSLAALGIEFEQISLERLAKFAAGITDNMVEQEVDADRRNFDVQAGADCHRRSARAGLVLRRCLDELSITAFSANFQAFDTADGPIDTVPFMEFSKAMARGIGYAGEGDVLTAGLVGALLAGWPETTFTEIFCPDWKGDALFLSHMGEINPAVAAARPVLSDRDFPWTPARNPVVLTCAPRPGPAVLVNIAPGPEDSFALLVAPVTVLEDGRHADTAKNVRGWVRPRGGVADFLERYSRLGGTHHSALVLGDHARAIAAFGTMAGLDVQVLD